jgi:hypothetical protein
MRRLNLKRFSKKLSTIKSKNTYDKIYTNLLSKGELFKNLSLEEVSAGEKNEIFRNHVLKSGEEIKKNEIIMKIEKKYFLNINDYLKNTNLNVEENINKICEELLLTVKKNNENEMKMRFVLRLMMEYNFMLYCKDKEFHDKIEILKFLISENKNFYPLNLSEDIIKQFFSDEHFNQLMGLKEFKKNLNNIFNKVNSYFIENDYSHTFTTIRQNLINIKTKIKFTDDEKIISPLCPILIHSFQPNISINYFYDFSQDQDYIFLKAEKDIEKNESLTFNYGNKRFLNSEFFVNFRKRNLC